MTRSRPAPSVTVTNMLVERAWIREFACATGQTAPEHVDVGAARQAGHPDLPATATFLFSLAFRTGDPWDWATEQGFDMDRALHGEQSFELLAPVHAGDQLTLTAAAGAVDQTASGLRRIRRRTEVTRDGAVVARLETVLVIPAGPRDGCS